MICGVKTGMFSLFANALICSGVAPQHPPIMFTKPESVNSESWAAI